MMIHGHTHRPADHAMAGGRKRIVLSDWDAQSAPPRLEALRITHSGVTPSTGTHSLTALQTSVVDHFLCSCACPPRLVMNESSSLASSLNLLRNSVLHLLSRVAQVLEGELFEHLLFQSLRPDPQLQQFLRIVQLVAEVFDIELV